MLQPVITTLSWVWLSVKPALHHPCCGNLGKRLNPLLHWFPHVQKQECDSYAITVGLSEVLNKVKYLKYLGSIFNHSEDTELKFLVAFTALCRLPMMGLLSELTIEQCFFLLLLLRPIAVGASVLRLRSTILKHLLVKYTAFQLELLLTVMMRPLFFHPHVAWSHLQVLPVFILHLSHPLVCFSYEGHLYGSEQQTEGADRRLQMHIYKAMNRAVLETG